MMKIHALIDNKILCGIPQTDTTLVADTTDLSAERVEEISEEATFDLEVRGEYGLGRYLLKVTL